MPALSIERPFRSSCEYFQLLPRAATIKLSQAIRKWRPGGHLVGHFLSADRLPLRSFSRVRGNCSLPIQPLRLLFR